MNITINHESKTPIYLQISTQIRKLVFSGQLSPGNSLPSERVLAKNLNVHRNTVVKAYNELKAEEIIEASQGVGYRVCFNTEKPAGKRGKAVNWVTQIKDDFLDMEIIFDDLFQKFSNKKAISLGSGIASPNIVDKKSLCDEMGKIMENEDEEVYFFTPYQGDRKLRKEISYFLAGKGIKASPSNIQLFKEMNQAIDYITALLINPGDAVILEEPVSPDIYRTIKLAGGKPIMVPVDEDGMCCNQIESLVEKYNPKFIIVSSSFQDPTSHVLSEERRRKIIEIANKHRLIIIEEDSASELSYSDEAMHTIKALDSLNNVVYIYSFQFTFVPGENIAFVVADKTLIKSLSYLLAVRMISQDWMAQKLLYRFLADGRYNRLLSRCRDEYKEKCRIMCEKLDEMKSLGVEYEKPKGGVYVWCSIPEKIDSKELVTELSKRGVSIIPGFVFYPKKNGGRNKIRINFSYESAEKIVEGMEILKETIRTLLAHEIER